MKDLKFRAWNDEKYIYAPNRFVYVSNSDDNYEDVGQFFCERDNIEQYTGLKDKNDKEIYEGDIVRDTLSNSIWVVRFEYGGFLPFTSDTWTVDNDYCEVIGNIHENPELFGGKE